MLKTRDEGSRDDDYDISSSIYEIRCMDQAYIHEWLISNEWRIIASFNMLFIA
jgi:hypothetical protein